jgi:hypothetical protein
MGDLEAEEDMAVLTGDMKPMEMHKYQKGRLDFNIERRRHKAQKTKLFIVIGLCAVSMIIFAMGGVIRELQWRSRVIHVKSKADHAIAAASLMTARHHFGSKDNIIKDIETLGALLDAGAAIDSTIDEEVKKTIKNKNEDTQKQAHATEKELIAKKKFGVESAMSTVVRTLEKDVAFKHGHPLLLRGGVPVSRSNARIDKLASALTKTEDAIDAVHKMDQLKADEIVLLSSSKESKDKTAVEELKGEVQADMTDEKS